MENRLIGAMSGNAGAVAPRLRQAAPVSPCAWGRGRRAAALLEVILALALFVGVAFAIVGGLAMSFKSAQDLKQQAQAADLATTVLSEVELGVMPASDAGPTAFDKPFDAWTWQTAYVPPDNPLGDGSDMGQLQIVIANPDTGYTYRLYESLPSTSADTTTTTAVAATTDTGTTPGSASTGSSGSKGSSSSGTGKGGSTTGSKGGGGTGTSKGSGTTKSGSGTTTPSGGSGISKGSSTTTSSGSGKGASSGAGATASGGGTSAGGQP